MALTQQQIEQIRKERGIVVPTSTPQRTPQKSSSLSNEEIQRIRQERGITVATPAPQEAQNAPVAPVVEESGRDTVLPQFEAVGDQPVRNVARTIGNIPSSAERLGKEVIAPINPFDTESPLNVGSNIVKGVQQVAGIAKEQSPLQALKNVYLEGPKDILKKGGDIYKGIGEKLYGGLESRVVGSNSVVKGVGLGVAEAASKIAEVGIEDPLLIPSLIYAPSKIRDTGVTGDSISALSDITKKTVSAPIKPIKAVVSKAFEPTTAKIESSMVESFQKGVKPRINANMTPGQTKKYKESIMDSARTIDENKASLKFVDDAGDIISGENPKTLQQLSDSLEQTKKSIFTDYDALANQAGDKGLKIKTNPIADELNNVINNEALQISNPQAVRYAQEIQERLSYRELTPRVTQDVIQNYNDSLKAFYRNPSYDNASRAGIDALVANKMRQQLDEGITSLTGQGYQGLKNKYSSLKTIEKDVIKASLRDARKNTKGLIDYTDILTSGDLITGVLTANPTAIARGGITRGIKEFYKYLNSPNRAIKNLFENTERLNQRLPRSQSIIPSKSRGSNLLPTQPKNNIATTPNKNVI